MINTTFNMHKIKFDSLDSMGVLNGHKKVRIFINLEIVINRLLNSRINNFLIANPDSGDIKRLLVSNIINLAQHYRLYCAKHKVENEVYMFWNYPPSKGFINRKYNPKYKASYTLRLEGNTDNWMVVKYLSEIYDSLTTIMAYINQVYLIDSRTIDSSLIPYIISKDRDDDTNNIIISSNDYDFQYTNKGFDIWVPLGERSIVLNSNNIMEYMKGNSKTNVNIPDTFIAFIVSILGNKSRNIDKIPGIGFSNAVKLINNGLDKLTITPNTINVELLAKCIPEEHRELFMNNYRTIQILYQYQDISGVDERDIFNQIVDKYDDSALIYMNDRFFKDHMIMTIDTRSEQIYRNDIQQTNLKW